MRPLAARDVPWATRLLNDEGWAFTEEEIARLLTLGGGVVVEDGGAPRGLLTLVTHAKVAWIGNVAVEKASRGRKLGAALVEAALARATSRGCKTVGLYSVLPAVSLYARAGFREAGDVASFAGTARPGPLPRAVRPLTPELLREAAKLDALAFGDDRSRMLATLVGAYPETSFAFPEKGRLRGFVIVKASTRGSEIGPLVTRAGDSVALSTLLDAAVASPPVGDLECGAHRANAAALAELALRGFRERFPAKAMFWGAAGHEGDPLAVGAVAGMEKG